MPTSLVVIRLEGLYLLVEGGKFASETNRAPLRKVLPLGSTKEDARPFLRQEDLPDEIYSPSVQVGSPYGKRTPSGKNMMYTARAYKPTDIWGFVKGQCNEYGLAETPLDCAVRELQEETSLEVDGVRLTQIPLDVEGLTAYILDVTAKEKVQIDNYL